MIKSTFVHSSEQMIQQPGMSLKGMMIYKDYPQSVLSKIILHLLANNVVLTITAIQPIFKQKIDFN